MSERMHIVAQYSSPEVTRYMGLGNVSGLLKRYKLDS